MGESYCIAFLGFNNVKSFNTKSLYCIEKQKTLNINEDLTFINHAGFCCIPPVSQSFVEKTFHDEPVKMRIELNVSHLRIPKIQPAANNTDDFSAYF